MANTLRFKRGLVSGIPTAALGEPLFTTDTFDLYIGNGTGNTRFQKYIASGTTSQLLRGDGSLLTMPIVLTSPSNGQVLKFNGTNWVNDSDAGITGSGSSGQIAYFTGATIQAGNNNLFWDIANGRLGIGTNTPNSKLNVIGDSVITSNLFLGISASSNSTLYIFNATNTGRGELAFNGTNNIFQISSSYGGSGTYGSIGFFTSVTERARITAAGRLLLGTTTETTQRLIVAGDVKFDADAATNGFYWDNTNKRLGIGRSTPLSNLHLGSTGGSPIYLEDTDATSTFNITSISNNGGNFNIETRNTSGTFVHADYQIVKELVNSQYHRWFNGNSTEIVRFDNNGSVAIGNTTLMPRTNLTVWKNITGDPTSFGIYSRGTIQSGVTTDASYFASVCETAAASFTLANLKHYRAVNAGFGAGSTVTNQYGYIAEASLTGATNNFGFYGDIASGTGRWNLYMNGTAANYINGSLSIGTTTQSGKLYVTLPGINTTFDSGTAADARIEFRRAGTRIGYLNWDSGVVTLQADSGNYLGFNAGGSERMRLDASGNLGLGVTPSAGSLWRQFEIGAAGASLTGRPSNTEIFLTQNAYHNNSSWIYKVNGTAAYFGIDGGDFRWYNAPSGTAAGAITFTERMRLFNATGNLTIGSTPTDAGFRLDVNGTMRVSGDASIVTGGNAILNIDGLSTSTSGIIIKGSGTERGRISFSNSNNMRFFIGSGVTQYLEIDATTRAATFSGNIGLNVTPSAWSGRAIQIGARASIASVTDDLMLTNNAFYDGTNWKYIQSTLASNYYQSAGVHVWRTAPSGTAGNNITWTEQMRVDASGNVGINATSINRRLTVGGTANAYMSFNASSYRNTTIGSDVFGNFIVFDDTAPAYRMILFADGNLALNTTSNAGYKFDVNGTMRATGSITISGGNGYQVINSAATNVTALRPTGGGTSIMSTNSNGLHIAVGTEAAGDLILASNNTERIRLSSNGFFSQINATNPSASITDSYIQYSADVTAGNAAPHFRTENGAVIKLYQETTGVGNAIFSQGGGNSVLDDSTFDGYTLRQIVRALRNQGILQ